MLTVRTGHYLGIYPRISPKRPRGVPCSPTLPSVDTRLREVLAQRDLDRYDLARTCGVDPKTAKRWIDGERTPSRRNRKAACKLLGVSEHFLWPGVEVSERAVARSLTEIVASYPDRASVPRDVWLQLLNAASGNVDVLVYSGTFLAQTNPRIAEMLLERAAAGAQIRLCFADPSGSAVALRDEEEGIHGTLGAKIRACMSYFVSLVGEPNCGIKLHNTTVYASIFRYDDQALINTHIWGRPASGNPLLHIRRVEDADSMFNKYVDSFDRIWTGAKEWTPANPQTVNGRAV